MRWATGCAAPVLERDWRGFPASIGGSLPRGFGNPASLPIRLNGDASQIVAEKKAACFTYQGEQGYMPMIGHLAEAGVVIHDEFREGNIAPASKNLEFIQACETQLPKGHRIAHVRLDSAGYQADIFNYCAEVSPF
jgi:hypothetical protein